MVRAQPFSSSSSSTLIDGAVAEQHHQDRQADGRFGRRHRQDEEHEDLPGHVAQVMREGDEVHVDRQQHQLDGHQQHDQVLAVQEDADHRQREQDAAQRQVVAERERPMLMPPRFAALGSATAARSSGAILTMRRRSAFLTATCCDGSMWRLSLRWRSVSAMAAMMATSSITAAICRDRGSRCRSRCPAPWCCRASAPSGRAAGPRQAGSRAISTSAISSAISAPTEAGQRQVLQKPWRSRRC